MYSPFISCCIIAIVKGNISIQNVVRFGNSIFVFKVSIYFILSTASQGLSQCVWNQIKFNQSQAFSYGAISAMKICYCFKIVTRIFQEYNGTN